MIPIILLLGALAPAARVSAVHPGDADQTYAIKAARLYMSDGRALEDGVLLVEGSKIRAVGRGVDIPPGTPVIEHPGSITAGFVAGKSYSSVLAESVDPTRAVLPEARIAFAFDAASKDFERALAAGITTLVLAPQPGEVVGGATAVVKSAGGRVLSDRAQLALSLSSQANRINRAPTSPAGTIAMLEESLANPKGTFALVATGRLPVLIAADERHEIARACEFAQEYKLRGALLGAPLAGELAELVKAAGLAVVLAPIGPGSDRRAMRSAVALAKAGVPIAFAIEAPLANPETLRLSAAMCVREGLDRAVALRALTSDAARIAGVEGTVGTLEKGMDADFVLWSGDPLDLSSSILSVYVDGVRRSGGGK